VGEIKVTDRRMFTPDGRLKEEFERELAAAPTVSAPEARPEPEPPAPEPAAAAAPEPQLEDAAGPEAGAFELPSASVPPAGLMELVEFVAGWALACMGDVPLPDGRLVRDLDGARFYIDLLSSLRERFSSALPPQDRHLFDSFLDQLRLRYVSRRG
jgi:hypothetical protein